MEVAVEDISNLRKALKITLPREAVDPHMDAAYKKMQSGAALKGFRKGKVPKKVMEKTYGERIKNEVSEKLIQDTYFDALAETKLEAVVHPDIKLFEFKDDGCFYYEAEIEIKPEFDLAQYKDLEIEHPEIVITDDEIAEHIEKTRRELAPLKAVEDRGAEVDDLIIIDFQGFENGTPLKHAAGTEYSLDIGSGTNGKEFEDMLLGLKKGEEAERSVKFPPDFANTVLAGKEIDFKITVKDLKERVQVAIDDDFAQDVDEEFKTLDDLKAHVRAQIKTEKEKTMDGDIADKIMLKLMESHDFALPARLVAYEINELVKELEGNLDRQGLSLEAAGLTREKVAEQYRESAERRIKGDFILKKIADQEDIKLAEEDLEKGYERIAQQYNMTVADVKSYFKGRNDIMPFMHELLNEKIIKFLRDAAKVVFVPAADESKETTEAAS
ncbi:MAG TPA: trigger factor [Desulfobacterales bacterium]|nr:trigger factor [Desulfobacterales bacterium]